LEKLYRRSFGFWLNLVKISKVFEQSSAQSLDVGSADTHPIRVILVMGRRGAEDWIGMDGAGFGPFFYESPCGVEAL
jgi:hypothetical protein